MDSIFKAYDIRGVYPDEIDAPKARRIGHAFARYLPSHSSLLHNATHPLRIVIGHDMRGSSPVLASAFRDGACQAGAEVIDIGLCTTPMLYTALIDGQFDGGAMITASHLPACYNGIKLCRQQAIPLSGADGLPEVEALYAKTPPLPVGAAAARLAEAFLERYIERLRPFIPADARVKCVVDAGNGMGGLDTPQVFERMPQADLISMYFEPDGHFPHHVPNPAEEQNTRELQQRVISAKANLGVALDGDADRAGFIDEHGRRAPADLMIAVLAEHFLALNPGATILYDLRASRAVPERIHELGGNPVQTRVGHSFIKQAMREHKAVFAGEMSGHYYFADAGYIDSGIHALLTAVALLHAKSAPLSELISPLARYARSGEINLGVEDAAAVIDSLKKSFADGEQSTLDGLSVHYPDWWFNLRPSHTEPVVRLVIEANDEATLELRKAQLLALIGSDPLRAE